MEESEVAEIREEMGKRKQGRICTRKRISRISSALIRRDRRKTEYEEKSDKDEKRAGSAT